MNCTIQNEWIVNYLFKAKAHSACVILLDQISSACKQYVEHSCSSWNWDRLRWQRE